MCGAEYADVIVRTAVISALVPPEFDSLAPACAFRRALVGYGRSRNTSSLGKEVCIRGSDTRSYRIKHRSCGQIRPIGIQPKRVTLKAGKNVHVEMENFLESGFAIGEEEIDPLTTQT